MSSACHGCPDRGSLSILQGPRHADLLRPQPTSPHLEAFALGCPVAVSNVPGTELGHNLRFTNLQAAVGLGQGRRMEDLLDRKRRIARAYTEGLADLEEIRFPVELEWATNVYWMYGLVLGPGRSKEADEMARKLLERGVETRPFFLGLHEQPALLDRVLFVGERYCVTEEISRRGLYLPSGLALTASQHERDSRGPISAGLILIFPSWAEGGGVTGFGRSQAMLDQARSKALAASV